MDDVLRNLMDGVRRLQCEWQDREAKLSEGSSSGDANAAKRREEFRRTMQVLSRFESCFRRASWKSGSEMVFPMLFGHLAFMTHRCWNLFMRKAIYLAAEAWRRAYGQLATHTAKPDSVGETVVMDGWSRSERDGADVYVGPEGDEYDAIAYAYEAFKSAKSGGAHLSAVTKALQSFKEGSAVEEDAAGPADLVAKTKGAHSVTLSQHDDWMHRGTHPIVRDMCLYVHSIWVYRVELQHHHAKDNVPDDSISPHIDIAFHPSYRAAKTWTQRIAVEPRIPKVTGFQFVAESSNAETHHLMKSILLRPLDLPDEQEEVYTKELRYLEAYKALSSPPAGEHWPAQRTDASSPGPFERGWSLYIAKQRELAKTARRKCLQRDLHAWSVPSLWTTREVEEELQALRDAKEWSPTVRNDYDEHVLGQQQIRPLIQESRG